MNVTRFPFRSNDVLVSLGSLPEPRVGPSWSKKSIHEKLPVITPQLQDLVLDDRVSSDISGLAHTLAVYCHIVRHMAVIHVFPITNQIPGT